MSDYKDKFKLNVKQNIFLAKKSIVQNIYNSARLEGINVTFPETQTILDGINIANIGLNDLETILNLRDAWKYLLRTVDEPLDVGYICKVNFYISRNESLDWGVLRYGEVGIGGTDFKPPIPNREVVELKLNEINDLPSTTERALEYFAWAVKNQLFWDGNKRTSTLIANKILIEGGAGILTVPDNKIIEFNRELSLYYNFDNKERFKEYIYKNLIVGMTIEKQKENVISDEWEPEV
ncbi:MAG: Fic family protein [Tissierellaceae bacterium]